jgi:hypothetical protein
MVFLVTLFSCSQQPAVKTQQPCPPVHAEAADFATAVAFESKIESARLLLPPPPSGMRRVLVTVKVSGIAHLIGQGPNRRLLLFPNQTPGHKLMLATIKDYVSTQAASLLTSGPIVQGTTGTSYIFRELPPGFEIDLPSIVETSLVFSDEGDTSNAECPSPQSTADDKSLHWLPHLSKASGVSVSAKPTFVQVDPSATDVSARLNITRGTLISELSRNLHSFEFVNPTSGTVNLTQAVATYLVYTFTVDLPSATPTFALQGHSFSTHASIPLGNFVPDPHDNIVIVLANVPIADFFNPGAATALGHFNLHYNTLNPGATPPTVRIKGFCRHGLSADVECGPTQIP